MSVIGQFTTPPTGGAPWSEAYAAENFVRGVEMGVQSWPDVCRYSVQGDTYGDATGFVYFIAVGDPYITHIKVGYTAGDPRKRLRSLQTGCPFKMRLLAFVFGNVAFEQELHDVLRDSRAEGEWFGFDEYVERIVKSAIGGEFQ